MLRPDLWWTGWGCFRVPKSRPKSLTRTDLSLVAAGFLLAFRWVDSTENRQETIVFSVYSQIFLVY